MVDLKSCVADPDPDQFDAVSEVGIAGNAVVKPVDVRGFTLAMGTVEIKDFNDEDLGLDIIEGECPACIDSEISALGGIRWGRQHKTRLGAVRPNGLPRWSRRWPLGATKDEQQSR